MADAMKLGEVIETLEALTKSPGADEFDKGARAARLDALDMLRPLAASPPAREEAPGEGAREAWFTTDVVEVEYRDGNGETHMFPNEVEWAEVVRWRPQPAAALRNRTSEPEAGAVACPACLDTWGECNTCGGSHKKDPRWIAAHPAPATADKLKVAAEALEKIKTHRIGRDPINVWTGSDLCRGIATKALAALNEGGE